MLVIISGMLVSNIFWLVVFSCMLVNTSSCMLKKLQESTLYENTSRVRLIYTSGKRVDGHITRARINLVQHQDSDSGSASGEQQRSSTDVSP